MSLFIYLSTIDTIYLSINLSINIYISIYFYLSICPLPLFLSHTDLDHHQVRVHGGDEAVGLAQGGRPHGGRSEVLRLHIRHAGQLG